MHTYICVYTHIDTHAYAYINIDTYTYMYIYAYRNKKINKTLKKPCMHTRKLDLENQDITIILQKQ